MKTITYKNKTIKVKDKVNYLIVYTDVHGNASPRCFTSEKRCISAFRKEQENGFRCWIIDAEGNDCDIDQFGNISRLYF